MILIHDGYVIDPKSGREGNYDILIDGDKIVKIAEKKSPKVLLVVLIVELSRQDLVLLLRWLWYAWQSEFF